MKKNGSEERSIRSASYCMLFTGQHYDDGCRYWYGDRNHRLCRGHIETVLHDDTEIEKHRLEPINVVQLKAS